MNAITLCQTEFSSSTLGNTRTLWLQRPQQRTPSGLCLFLDAEYYVTQIRAAKIVDELQQKQQIYPVACAYVSHIDSPTRWEESFCNDAFAAFLCDELVPYLEEELSLPSGSESTIVGLSLTGLSAAHAALCSNGMFSRAVCQSGSFWWDDEWLVNNLPPSPPLRFRIVVGDSETEENVDHGEGLIQKTCQRDSNRRMRDALIANGHSVSYAEYFGGHEMAPWREDLAGSLAAVFSG